MSPEELRNLLAEIVALHDAVGRLFADAGHDPLPGSKAEHELRSYERPTIIETAYSQATLLIEAASDHLILFTRSMQEPVLSIAPWSGIRSLLEASAVATWLLDGQIGATERAIRSFSFRLEGLHQQAKLARSSHDDAVLEKVGERTRKIERDANTLGIPSHYDKHGNLAYIGAKMPAMTELSATVLKDELAYRLLSAVLHGHSWALQQAGFVKVKSGSHLYLERSIQPLAILYLSSRAVHAFIRPVLAKAVLYGWDARQCAALADSINSRIALLVRASTYPLPPGNEQSA
jgi:hypothetical protein